MEDNTQGSECICCLAFSFSFLWGNNFGFEDDGVSLHGVSTGVFPETISENIHLVVLELSPGGPRGSSVSILGFTGSFFSGSSCLCLTFLSFLGLVWRWSGSGVGFSHLASDQPPKTVHTFWAATKIKGEPPRKKCQVHPLAGSGPPFA